MCMIFQNFEIKKSLFYQIMMKAPLYIKNTLFMNLF